VFEASVTRLIQLYIVGVFTSFTFGQAGMVRHWNACWRAGPSRRSARGRAAQPRDQLHRRGAHRAGAG
jgi:hypothetical protein